MDAFDMLEKVVVVFPNYLKRKGSEFRRWVIKSWEWLKGQAIKLRAKFGDAKKPPESGEAVNKNAK